jgi:thiol-disulfide isomerase/thioredoxin
MKLKLTLMLYFLAMGCVNTLGPETKPSEPGAEESAGWGEGIVSENPPQYGDNDDDDSAGDDDDSSSEDAQDTQATPEEVVSYEGCSNIMPASPWEIPETFSQPCNFRLTDQNGDEVELYDFEGSVILLDFSTMWCYVCKTVATHVQEFHDQNDPFVAITILTETSQGNDPQTSDLVEWTTAYGITTAPVLAGNSTMIGTNADQWFVQAWPTFYYIDKDFMVRQWHAGWNEQMVTNNVQALIVE